MTAGTAGTVASTAAPWRPGVRRCAVAPTGDPGPGGLRRLAPHGWRLFSADRRRRPRPGGRSGTVGRRQRRGRSILDETSRSPSGTPSSRSSPSCPTPAGRRRPEVCQALLRGCATRRPRRPGDRSGPGRTMEEVTAASSPSTTDDRHTWRGLVTTVVGCDDHDVAGAARRACLCGPETGERLVFVRTALAVLLTARLALSPFRELGAGMPDALYDPAWVVPCSAFRRAAVRIGHRHAAGRRRRRRRSQPSLRWRRPGHLRGGVALARWSLAGLRTSRGKVLHNDLLLLWSAAPFLLAPAQASWQRPGDRAGSTAGPCASRWPSRCWSTSSPATTSCGARAWTGPSATTCGT